MTQVKALEVSGNDLFGDFSGGFIGKMAMAAEDTLFDAPGSAGVVLEELEIMVGLEDEDIGGPNPLNDELGGVPKVGQESDFSFVGSNEEADRIISIMRNRKRVDGDIADVEAGAGGKDAAVQRAFELLFDRFLGQPVAIDGNAEFAGAEGSQALNMIGMFVGDKDTGETFGRATD